MRLGMSGRGKLNIKLPIAALILCAAVIFTGVRLHNAFLSAAHAYANNIATTSISDSVYEVFSEIDNSEYSIITDDDRATLFSTDTARVNLINSRLSALLQKKVLEGGSAAVKIPLGSILGIAAFSGAGPGIPVKIRPVSLVNTDFDEVFESCGINQVRHSVSLNVEFKMAYSGYLFSDSEIVKVTVPVTDTVIVGDVPEYYGGGEFLAGNDVNNEIQNGE